MLLVPLVGKIDLKNPPWAVIAVVLANVLVFTLFQLNDNDEYRRAVAYYFDSGLADIEIPRYILFDQGENPREAKPLEVLNLSEAKLFAYYQKAEADDGFQKALLNGAVVCADENLYENWRTLRSGYAARLQQVTFYHYGFRPSHPRPATWITHAFLHGGWMHLIGNMIFLWLVGCVIEMAYGRTAFLVMYFLGSVAAVGLFWLIYMQSTVPLVGASGAVSGLMGAFTVLFGRKKIKIFYSLGFYFDYIRITAIFLLPLWIGNELIQLFFGGVSQVAYVAHIGGLTGGAALGYACRKWRSVPDASFFRETPEDKVSPLIEKALTSLEKLDLESAEKLLQQALAHEPENANALFHLYNIHKLDPEKNEFHATTEKLLRVLGRNPENHAKMCRIFQEYRDLAKKPRLTAELCAIMAVAYFCQGRRNTCKQLLALMIQKWPAALGIPKTLARLIELARQQDLKEEEQRFKKLLTVKFPQSSEARAIRAES